MQRDVEILDLERGARLALVAVVAAAVTAGAVIGVGRVLLGSGVPDHSALHAANAAGTFAPGP